jgi:multidrug efflux pump subunit AcrB
MALNVSAWAIRHPLPPLVVTAVLLGIGFISYLRIPITRMPNVDVPVISVTVSQFGASPAELETQVAKKIEDAVSGVEGVRHIRTVITDGIASVQIEFRLETTTDRALNDVKDAITRIRSDLPRTLDTEPMVQRFDVAGLAILTYAAIAPNKTPEQVSWFVEDVIVRRLQGLRGVGNVERLGSVEREVRVGLYPAALQAVGVTAPDISRQLRGSNADLAGGRSEIGGHDQAIRTLAGARTIAGLGATRISFPGGGDVRLDDLALVTDTIAEPRTFARFNGNPVVGFSIYRAKGASDVKVEKLVSAEIEAIKKEYPDVDLKLIDSSVTYTLGNYDAALENWFEGAALTVIVIFLFLRDWRATLVAGVTVPLSIVPSFWIMDMLGFSLNIITMVACVLSTGILVDDAIVEIENIVRHIRMGKSPYRAAIEAADEIGLAVVAITLTIVAVFLPASFMPSIPGQFFKQFGITVSVQVLFSLLCARFITPMLAAYLLQPHQHEEKADGPMMRGYSRLLVWSVRHRFITVVIGVLVLAAALEGARRLPSGFLPPQDTARSTMAIELPPGLQLADTQALTDAIVNRLRRRPDVESVFVNGGKIPPATQEVRKATLTINYVPRSKRSLSQVRLEQAIIRDLADIPDFRFWIFDDYFHRPVNLIVTGADSETVANVASELMLQMRRLPQVTNIVSEGGLIRPELRIYPRRDLAVRLGVSTESLSQTIRVATVGDVAPALAKYDTGDRLVPIRVLLEEHARADQQVLEQLRVPSPLGVSVPLAALADFNFGQGPIAIERYDRKRQASVGADLVEGAELSQALAAVRALPMMKNLPPGTRVFEVGDAELRDDLFAGFTDTARNGLVMVYALLAVLFGSLLQPLTILLSLPLSIAGAIGALLLTGFAVTTPVLIGMLMLMGIVSKNAIMLVDFAVEAIHHGMERHAAIIEAGLKRVRPILMTTIAMVAGMTPSALGFGAGGDLRSPMATAVIGGLIVATLLSLLFVPALFTILEDFGAFCWRLFSRFIGEVDEAEPAHATGIAGRDAHGKELAAGSAHGGPRKGDLSPGLTTVPKPAHTV